MIFRIDIQHFLSHMIDYFTREELIHFQYAIISAKIPNQGRCSNVVKVNNLYPDVDTITAYADYKDRDIAEKMYFEMLKNDESAIEDNDDSDNIEYESVGNDAEDAAVAALMNSSSNSINVPEEDNTLESELINGKDYSEDEEVETSEEEVVINDNNENVEDVPDNSDYHEYDNEDDNQMMFQPIRRKKKLE